MSYFKRAVFRAAPEQRIVDMCRCKYTTLRRYRSVKANLRIARVKVNG